MNPDLLSTVNGIDFALFLGILLVGFGRLYARDRWTVRLRAAEDRADSWATRCVEAQGEVERLRASVDAEVEARLDAEVEARLEAAEQAQSAHDRVEALAEAVRHRLEAQGLHDSEAAEVHRLLDQLGAPRRDFSLAGRVRHALELECLLRAQAEQTNRALHAVLEATRVVPRNDPSEGPNAWEADAVTMLGVQAVELPPTAAAAEGEGR